MIYHHQSRWRHIAIRALASGGVPSGAYGVLWNASGTCQRPVFRELRTRTIIGRSPFWEGNVQTATYRSDRPSTDGQGIELHVRCRQCESCLKSRARMWAARAAKELAAAPRSWFGTLTLRPEQHFRMASLARLRLARQGVDFDTLTEAEQFRERHREINRVITLYVKRLRKEAAGKLRLVCVVEQHKSGLPHYHLIVHEQWVGAVRHKTLSNQWQLGFSKWKVVADNFGKIAHYVAKYLAKSSLSRVRSSVGYGLVGEEATTSVDSDGTEREGLTPPGSSVSVQVGRAHIRAKMANGSQIGSTGALRRSGTNGLSKAGAVNTASAEGTAEIAAGNASARSHADGGSPTSAPSAETFAVQAKSSWGPQEVRAESSGQGPHPATTARLARCGGDCIGLDTGDAWSLSHVSGERSGPMELAEQP